MLHVCGQCKRNFESEQLYLQHHCKVAGLQPIEQLKTFRLSEGDIVAAVAASRQHKDDRR